MPDDDVRAALEQAYADGSWGRYHGPAVTRLEEGLATFHGLSYCLCCASGTLAVEVGLRALGVGPGDEVVMAGYDYDGNFLSVHALDAVPALVDVRPENWNLDVNLLREAIGPKTRAILVSHLHGGVVPMADVMTAARAHGIGVLEDAAQMPGGLIQGRRAGTWGDIGVLSFGGSKLLSAGRGGALLTDRADLHQRARLALKRGNNLVAPLSELQAAVLLPQMAKLGARNEHRLASVERLRHRLTVLPGLALFENRAECRPGYYKVGIKLDAGAFGLARPWLVEAVRAEGIAIDEGFAGLHVGRAASRYKKTGDLKHVDAAHAGALVLHHPILLGAETDVDQIAVAFEKVQRHAAELAAAKYSGVARFL